VGGIRAPSPEISLCLTLCPSILKWLYTGIALCIVSTFSDAVRGNLEGCCVQRYSNNNLICIAPYGCDFRGADLWFLSPVALIEPLKCAINACIR